MRDDPWTAANRDKEQQKIAMPPRRKPTSETASPVSKPMLSGPFWTVPTGLRGPARPGCSLAGRGRSPKGFG
jgi:hypothetical protein